jgi:hypothetical protein
MRKENFYGFETGRILRLRHDLYDYNSNFTKDKLGQAGLSRTFNRSCRNFLAPAFTITSKSCDT